MRGLGALLSVVVMSSAAAAETPQQQADRLFAEGRELLTVKNDAKAACEKFEAAIKLDVTATGTMLNLGLCYENLGKYATSIRWFRKAQAAAAENHLVEYEKAAKDHTVTISPKVPTLKLNVTAAADAEVAIDGIRIPSTDYGRVEVDPGTHEIVGRAPGMRRVTRSIDVKESESQTVDLVINEVAVPVYEDRGAARRRTALVVGAGGLVVLGASLGLNLYWRSAQEDVNHLPRDASDAELPEGRENYNFYENRMRYVGTSVFAVGAAAVLAGGILYFTAPGKELVSDGTAMGPVITSDQLGFAVSGRF